MEEKVSNRTLVLPAKKPTFHTFSTQIKRACRLHNGLDLKIGLRQEERIVVNRLSKIGYRLCGTESSHFHQNEIEKLVLSERT